MKKTGKIILLLLCFMFLIAGQVWAAEREYDVVRANGSVTREVTPDTAFVNVGVTTQGKTAEEARNANAEIVNNIIASLENTGIAKEDVKTVGYNLYPEYSDAVKGKRIITGYSMSYSLSVKVQDLDKIGAVIDQMFADGANNFNGVTFTVSNRKELEREMLALALTNAEEKAGIVANAGGRSLGKLVGANIGSVGGMDYSDSNYESVMLYKSAAGSAPTKVMAGSLKVSADIDAVFELL